MKKFTFAIVTLFISFYAQAQDDWKSYKFSKYKFTIDLIEEPVFTVDTLQFEGQEIFDSSWEVNVSDTLHENIYYGVEMVEYPSEFIHSDSIPSTVEGFINSTQNGLLNDGDSELLSSRLVEKQGYPGKVFRWKNKNNGVHFDFHVYLVESRLYTLSLVSAAGKNHNLSIHKYFDSFSLIDLPLGSYKVPKIELVRTHHIKFPGKAVSKNRMVDSELGKLPLLINVCETPQSPDNKVYVAMETKYPRQVASQDDVYGLNKFYKKSIDQSLKAINGELISIKDVYYKKKLGKEYRAYFMEGKALAVYRIFYIGENVYTFGVITMPDKDNNTKMNDFFSSFQIEES